MKIMIFSYYLTGKGGTESVLNSWNKELPKYIKNFSMDLLVSGEYPDLSFIDIKNIFSLDVKNKISLLKGFITTWKLIRKNKYDIIVCLGFNHLRMINFILKFIYKKPRVILWTHFRIEKDNFNKRNKQLLKNTDIIFCLCNEMKKQFLQLDVKNEKIKVLYNPIKRSEKINRSLSGKNFYFIGRLYEEQKRISDIIKALGFLRLEGYSDITLTILGDGEDLWNYINLVKLYNLEKQITFINIWFKDPWEIIKEMDCLILSSNFEGFGLVLAEAISHGVPVISSNCPVGPNEIVKNGVNGYLYEVGDVLGLSKNILKIINNKIINQKQIMESISEMYTDNYYEKLSKILLSNVF